MGPGTRTCVRLHGPASAEARVFGAGRRLFVQSTRRLGLDAPLTGRGLHMQADFRSTG